MLVIHDGSLSAYVEISGNEIFFSFSRRNGQLIARPFVRIVESGEINPEHAYKLMRLVFKAKREEILYDVLDFTHTSRLSRVERLERRFRRKMILAKFSCN